MANVTVIPAEAWKPFLDDFARDHRGWLVTIEWRGPAARRREIVRRATLDAISLTEPDAAGVPRLTIRVRGGLGHPAARLEQHTLADPHALTAASGADPAYRGLHVQTRCGEAVFVCVWREEPADASADRRGSDARQDPAPPARPPLAAIMRRP